MKRLLALLVALTFAFSLLTGCGSTSKNSKDESQTSKVTPTTEQKEPVTITHLTSKTVNKDFLDKMFSNFEKETGTKVQADYVIVDNYSQILSTKIAAGEVPDTFQVFPYHTPIGLYGLGQKGLLLDITNEPWQKDYIKGVKKQIEINLKLYAISTVQHILPVLYNKKLFKQANIDKIPTTLAEFMDVCAKLKTAKIIPISIPAKDNGWFFVSFAMAPPLVFSQDMDWQAKREKGEVKFATSEGWIKVIGTLDEMFKKGYFIDKPLTVGYADSLDIFSTGKAAMTIMGNWEFENLQKKGGEGFEMGAFFFPTTDGKNLVYSGSIGDLFAASAKTKHPNESKALLGYFAKNAESLSVTFGGLPTVANADPEKMNPIVKGLLPIIQSQNSYTFLDNTWPAGFGDFISKGAQAIMTGKQTVDQVLKDADTQFEEKYKLAQEKK